MPAMTSSNTASWTTSLPAPWLAPLKNAGPWVLQKGGIPDVRVDVLGPDVIDQHYRVLRGADDAANDPVVSAFQATFHEKIGHGVIGEWQVFVSQSKRMFLFAGDSYDITSESKESLVGLLEFAEQTKLHQVFVCLERKQSNAAKLLKGLLYLGFSLVSPRRSRFTYNQQFVLLRYNVGPQDC
eukprot:Clim_evm37s202 gene=Clim_evmTU37s202